MSDKENRPIDENVKIYRPKTMLIEDEYLYNKDYKSEFEKRCELSPKNYDAWDDGPDGF